jgi:hypothetical protein
MKKKKKKKKLQWELAVYKVSALSESKGIESCVVDEMKNHREE